METEQKEEQKALPGKKELKQQLTDKMEAALPELRGMLGEKKFLHRLKKAAKLLMQGVHKDDVIKKKQEKTHTVKKTAAKKTDVKKAATKQATAKKATTKAASAKKAKATKKGSTS